MALKEALQRAALALGNNPDDDLPPVGLRRRNVVELRSTGPVVFVPTPMNSGATVSRGDVASSWIVRKPQPRPDVGHPADSSPPSG
jgi:hypothetical protein